MKIGFVTLTNDKSSASGRLRAFNLIEMINKDGKHSAEIYSPNGEYNTLIFVKACRPQDLELLNSFQGLTILDLCDNLLEQSKYVDVETVKIAREMAHQCTCVSVCSEELGIYASRYNNNIFYIPDLIDCEKRRMKIVWFGLASNWRAMKQYSVIFMWLKKKHDFEIHAIADWSNCKEKPEINGIDITLIEWNEELTSKYLNDYDLFFSPKMIDEKQWENCKSDNKVLMALKQGLNVIASPIPEYEKIAEKFPNKVKCFHDLIELDEYLSEAITEFNSIQSYHSREEVFNGWICLLKRRGIQVPTISVITPTYNSSNTIRETIESVLAQTYDKFEYIIVDDCSSDDTVKILEEYAKKDSRIKIFKNKKNLGQEKTKNIAIKHSSGKIIVPIDADDIATPKRLELSEEALKENDIIYGDYYVFGDTNERYCKAEEFSNERMLEEKNLINANTVAFKRGVFYGSDCKYAGDYEAWLRGIVNGKKFKVIHKPLVYYRVKNNSLWHKNLKECEKEKKMLQKKYSNLKKNIESSSYVPSISIIMPTYNRRRIIPKSIETVLAQTFQSWELIIVNDGGEDISKVIELYNDSRIRYVTKENGGLSSALNYGIERARAPLIALLDDDDLWEEEHLTTLYENMGVYDVAYTNCEKIKPNGEHIIYYNIPFDKKEILYERNIITTCSVIFKKKVWSSVKGFDEQLVSHMDWDFWKKIIVKGYTFKQIDKFTSFYVAHGGNMLLSRNPIHSKDRIMVRERYI